MAIQTNTGERAKLIRVIEGEEHITDGVQLYVNGATTASGAWSTVKNIYDRGQTITLGTTITSTAESNNNSFHGTLIYPSNKVTVAQGATISLDIASTNQYTPVAYCVDTNVTTWGFRVSVVYRSSVPDDFHSTFAIDDWVNARPHNTLINVEGSGSQSSKNIPTGTLSATVPVSGSYYVCLVIHGYDSKTYQLSIGNVQIGEGSNVPYAQTVITDTGIGLYPDYIHNELICWLDGNCNTRHGFDSNAVIWEDLSGNNNDFTIINSTVGNTWWGEAWNSDSTKIHYNSYGYMSQYIDPKGQATNCKIYRDNFDPFNHTTGFTLEFCCTTWYTSAMTIYKGYPDSVETESYILNNAFNAQAKTGSRITVNNAYATGIYHTYTISMGANSTTLNVFIDGKFVQSLSTTNTSTSVNTFYIFSRNADAERFNGHCAGFRAYNRGLNREEIAHNAQLDRLRYNYSGNVLAVDPIKGLKSFDVLRANNVQTALETNARITQNADGTWSKTRTTTSTGETQGCLWVEVDLTDYRFVNFSMNVTTDGGSDSYKIKGIVTQSNIANNSQSLTTMVDMGRKTGNRFGVIDVSSMTGTYKVGIQTGTQLGTIRWITCWR